MCEDQRQIVNPRYKKWSKLFGVPLHKYQQRKDYLIMVSCGHCPDCLKRRAKAWFSRAHYICESQGLDFSDCYFCTFTIKPEVYEEVKDAPYIAIRRFLDRLRKHPRLREKNPETGRYRYRKVKFPYFFVIEFADGETAKKRGLPSTHRMHFHAILFGCPLYPIEVEDLWQRFIGRADVQRCDEEAGIAYVLKYVCKDNKAEQYLSDIDARKNGKLFVSHGFGRLSEEDVERYREHMDKSDSSYFSQFIGTFRYPIPKYWKNQCFSDIEVKQRNEKIVPKLLYRQIVKEPLSEYRDYDLDTRWYIYSQVVLPFLSDKIYNQYLENGIDVLKSQAESAY